MTYLKISFTLQKFFFSFSFYYFDSTVLSPFLFCKLNKKRCRVEIVKIVFWSKDSDRPLAFRAGTAVNLSLSDSDKSNN